MAQVLMYTPHGFRGVISNTPTGTAYSASPDQPLSVDQLDEPFLLRMGFVAAAPPVGDGSGSGGIAEAPSDGNTYGRGGAAWTPVLPMGGGDVGPIGVLAPGIHFPTMTSANANYQLAWTGNRIWPYVNGIAQGAIAYISDIPAPAVNVSSFNTRTGAVTLGSTDVTAALAFTPYNATNPAGYQTAPQVTTLARTGTTTNDSAAAGQIGEFISAQRLSTAGITLTSGVDAAITSLALTAGDWDVYGSAGFTLANNNSTILVAWFNATGVVTPSPDQFGGYATEAIGNNIGTPAVIPISPMRVSIAAPATVTLGSKTTFSGGTHAAWGQIMARRAR
jgi:hypothetical protein